MSEDCTCELIGLLGGLAQRGCAHLDRSVWGRRRDAQAECRTPGHSLGSPHRSTSIDKGEPEVGRNALEGAAQLHEGKSAAWQVNRQLVAVPRVVEEEHHAPPRSRDLGRSSAGLGQRSHDLLGTSAEDEDRSLGPNLA